MVERDSCRYRDSFSMGEAGSSNVRGTRTAEETVWPSASIRVWPPHTAVSMHPYAHVDEYCAILILSGVKETSGYCRKPIYIEEAEWVEVKEFRCGTRWKHG